MKKQYSLIFVLLAAALVLSACGQAQTPEPISTTPVSPDAVISEGHVVPRDSLMMSFPVNGKVAEILVEEGDTVKEGDVLVRLADREQAEAALAAAKLAQTTAQQNYDEFVRTAGLSTAEAWQIYMDAQVTRADAEKDWEKLNVDNIEDRIDDAKAEVEDRKKDLEDAQDDFDKYKDLDEDNSSYKNAKDDLENAQDDYNAAVRKLEKVTRERDTVRAALDQAMSAEAEAKRKYEQTAAADGLDPDRKAILEANLNNANAQVAAAEDTLSNYELKAPFDGTITDVNVSVNEMVGPQTQAVQIADFSEWYVDTSDLTELEVVKIAKGQTATVVADALPGVEMVGMVDKISQSYKSQGGDILYTVRLSMPNIDSRLRWGMTVEVTFPPTGE
jgi:HlyD family secretion protein